MSAPKTRKQHLAERTTTAILAAAFAVFIAVDWHFVETCPGRPNAETRQIYPLTEKSHTVFLDEAQHEAYVNVEFGVICLFLLRVGVEAWPRM